jgi:hypothetical protein
VSSGGFSKNSEVTVNWILGGSLSDISAANKNIIDKIQSEELRESQISLKVYPSPVSDIINIEIPMIDKERINLELFDNSGVKVFNTITDCKPVLHLNVSEFPAGIYYLKAFQPSSDLQLFKNEKIIIQ